MNRGSRLLLKIAMPLASVALTLLALEGLVRLLGLDTASYNSISGFCRYDPNLGWNLIPNQRTVFRGRHFSTLVETSEQGLRDGLYPVQREPGRRRILVLGDSYVWCWGVELDQCFTKRIERRLADTDVIGMGVPGFSTAQELLLYEEQGSRFRADLVLLVFVGNDLSENLDGRKRPRFIIDDGELVRKNYPAPRRKSRVKEWLRANSRLWVQVDFASQAAQALLKSWREGGGPAPEGPSTGSALFVLPGQSEEGEARELVLALLERLATRVGEDGARFAIVAVDTPESYSRALTEFCALQGCEYVDTGPAIAAASAEGLAVRLEGDPHLSPLGQNILAELILELLRSAGWEPEEPDGGVVMAQACR